MSLLDKINDSTLEIKNNEESYLNQIKELESQLHSAKEENKKNMHEIKELKSLINEYNIHLNNLKLNYNDAIEELKAQINFEKEINSTYLNKLVQTNKDINNNIDEIKSTSNLKVDGTNSLLNLIKDELSKSNESIIKEISEVKAGTDGNNFSEEINSLKESFDNKNDKVVTLLNSIKNSEAADNSPDALNSEKIDNLENLIKSNYEEVTNLINQNRDNHKNSSSQIIDLLNNNNEDDTSLVEINKLEDLLNNTNNEISNIKLYNKEVSDENANRIINEIIQKVNTVDNNELLNKISDIVQSNNKDVSNNIDETTITKIEILNKISDDLKNNNYTNLKAYKQIKQMNLFDEVFYKEVYDYNLDIDPLLHFIYKGYDENKKPSNDFSPLYYKSSDDKVNKSTLNPLVYFVTKGINEGNIQINEDVGEIKHINKKDIDAEINSFTDRGVKKSKRKPRLIVSLTTIPERIHEVHYTLYSLLNQEVKPDKLMLWLNKDDFPNGELDLPSELLKLKQNGLSLKFSDNYKSYTKIVPTLLSYPNDIVITADDDIFYPRDWLKILYDNYRKDTTSIVAHKVNKISLFDEDHIRDYSSWDVSEDEGNVSYLNFPSSKAGVLYPPNSLHEDMLNSELFLDLCEYAPDIWLWAMAVLNNNKIKIAENNLSSDLVCVNPLRDLGIINEYSLRTINEKDDNFMLQFKNILDKYPEIIDYLKEEYNKE